ncbi:MAG: hypothetical protein JRI97_01405 [Deltaproteobacteria bacterium]|nr:hypothetical protein [Deltaproteobacteria bacterium]
MEGDLCAVPGYAMAGLTVRVTGPPGLSLPDPGPTYAPFHLDEPPARPDILVRVVPEPGPRRGKTTLLFSGGPAWSLYRENGGFILEFSPPEQEGPLWVARADAGFSSVDIFCRPREGRLAFHPLGYPGGQLLLLHALARRGGVLVHAAGFAYKGRGFLFPGRSGAGKTTLARLARGHGELSAFTDDRGAVTAGPAGPVCHGTPWAGEAGVAKNVSLPLSGLLFLAHGQTPRLTRLKKGEALRRLLPTASIPWYDPGGRDPALGLCGSMSENVPAWEFAFTPGEESLSALCSLLEEQCGG